MRMSFGLFSAALERVDQGVLEPTPYQGLLLRIQVSIRKLELAVFVDGENYEVVLRGYCGNGSSLQPRSE
jgi:hypothetical protein